MSDLLTEFDLAPQAKKKFVNRWRNQYRVRERFNSKRFGRAMERGEEFSGDTFPSHDVAETAAQNYLNALMSTGEPTSLYVAHLGAFPADGEAT